VSHTKGRIRKGEIREGKLKLQCFWCAYCRGGNIVILNWLRPLWEGDQELVKWSDRDEPMCVEMHMCMEAILGISLNSYLYLKLAKRCLYYYLLIFSSTKSDNRKAE
jgi:hypothetical protein